MTSRITLPERLAANLPKGFKIGVYHLCSDAEATESLYFPPLGTASRPTTLETHFLGITSVPDNILIYGIEILIYITNYSASPAFPRFETMIFVSKADTSGYLPRKYASFLPAAKEGQPAPARQSTVRAITATFLDFLIDEHLYRRPDVSKLTISLFARAQNQYLFPDSVSVPTKHILNDRELIRWWCRVLDPIYQERAEAEGTESARAFLLVPGMDKYEILRMFPTSTRFPANFPEVKHHWVEGHPFESTANLSVREVVPYFPDDPKARFLDELNYRGLTPEDYGKKLGGGWRTIKTLDAFWEAMSFRQECCGGNCVGFMWVEINLKDPDLSITKAKSRKPKPAPREDIAGRIVYSTKVMSDVVDFLTVCPPDGPSDFCTEELAKSTTEDFIKLALEKTPGWKGPVQNEWDWGKHIEGQIEVAAETLGENKAPAGQTVNVLGVRRKREPEAGEDTSKKAKTQENGLPPATTINVLSVRKKPKPQ